MPLEDMEVIFAVFVGLVIREGFGKVSTTRTFFLPGIEFVATEKLAFSAGCAFDTFGKFGGHKVTPALTMYYRF
jgi:hypothetical protein